MATAGRAIMHDVWRKSRSVILYGSSIMLGLIMCKAWLLMQLGA